jgi:hypothetical protein
MRASAEIKEYIRSQLTYNGYSIREWAKISGQPRWLLTDMLSESPERQITPNIMDAFLKMNAHNLTEDVFDIPKLCQHLKLLPASLVQYIAVRPELTEMCLTLYEADELVGSNQEEAE